MDDDRLVNLSKSDILWDEICEINHLGKEMTYDLEIEKNHNFIANDIFVHNSGSIEQDADNVIFIHNPSMYGQSQDQEETECIIAKHRDGKTDSIMLKFKRNFTLFQEYTQEGAEEEDLPF